MLTTELIETCPNLQLDITCQFTVACLENMTGKGSVKINFQIVMATKHCSLC